MAQPQGLSDSPALIQWLRTKLDSLRPSAERAQHQGTMEAIQQANPNMPPMNPSREIPQAVLPPPQAPKGYSIQDIIRDAQANRPSYDAQGRPIPRSGYGPQR